MSSSYMTEPSAKVILDSISPDGHRLTTFEVVMHRFVLAEANTHRVFSKNSASSRAIPVEKMLAQYDDFPALPVKWTSEQPGMSGGKELEDSDLFEAQALLFDIHSYIGDKVNNYISDHPDKSTRLHKSVLNRVLEPFMYHKVIITSTDYDNFFAQRIHPDAQPEIAVVAEAMKKALDESIPNDTRYGQWHMPYVSEEEIQEHSYSTLLKISAARCARVSYLSHDGVRDISKDIDLFEKLTSADPPHYSPLEHVATPAFALERQQGNFNGWAQLRHEYREIQWL